MSPAFARVARRMRGCTQGSCSIAAVIELDDRSHDSPQRTDADRRKAAVCAAARIAPHRMNVNPLPNEADLHALLQLAPAAATATANARVVPLRGRPQ